MVMKEHVTKATLMCLFGSEEEETLAVGFLVFLNKTNK